MNVENNILEIHYKELPISNSLKRFFAIHKIQNLEKLLELKSSDMLKMKWFNVELWRQLMVLLEDHGYLEKLK